MLKQCLYCGDAFRFKAFPSDSPGRGRFCSKSCRAKSRTGEKNSNWRGGHINDSRGRLLVYAPGNPAATMFGGTHAYEYRLVAARTLGRPLRDDEIVHHINGDTSDNSPENLEVMTQSDHARLHAIKRWSDGGVKEWGRGV